MLMNIQITPTENGTYLGEHIIFSPQTIVPGIINLPAEVGEEMAYDRGNLLCLNFPGEYDISGTLINVYLGINGKLNYLIVNEKMRCGIIQSPDVLESDEVCDMETWIFSDDAVGKKLDQVEMEGEKVDLKQLSLSTQL
jgi:hypothetical protein